MTKFNEATASDEALERESLAWVNHLLSGAVTDEDTRALGAWRAQSPVHERTFADTVRFQRAVRDAVRAERDESAAAVASRPRSSPRAVDLRRRALIAGPIAASIAGYLVVKPPAHLWPSLGSLMSDYRTGTGERRRVAPAPGVALELNTQTDVNLASATNAPGIDLVSGEAEATVARAPSSPFAITARAGRILISQGRVNVRNDRGSVCVTCVEGRADIHHRNGKAQLLAGRQLVYTDAALGGSTDANLAAVTGWRRGLLLFRDEPLQHVIDELNRYRPGRIVLMDPALASRPVYGVFQLDQIGGAVAQVQKLTGAKATELPGGLLVLS
jgi:transmembrane sensor